MWEQLEKLIIRKVNGTKDIKRALKNKFMQLEYEKAVQESFAKFQKPPIMLTDEEKAKIRHLITIMESRKAKGILDKQMTINNLFDKKDKKNILKKIQPAKK